MCSYWYTITTICYYNIYHYHYNILLRHLVFRAENELLYRLTDEWKEKEEEGGKEEIEGEQGRKCLFFLFGFVFVFFPSRLQEEEEKRRPSSNRTDDPTTEKRPTGAG